MKIFAVLITIIFLSSSLYGCKKESPPPPRQVSKAKKIEVKPTPVPEELTQLKGEEKKSYTYNPRGKRDPFAPLIAIPKDKIRTLAGTLESYDLSDFKLIATAGKENDYYALLLAPDNKAYTVRVGSAVGLHGGKVRKIMKNKIIMIEYFKDYKGVLKPRKILLELHKGEE